MGRDPQVVVTNYASLTFQYRSNLAIRLRGGWRKAFYWNVLDQFRQLRKGQLPLVALVCAMMQLPVGDCQHDQLLWSQAFEAGGYLGMPVLCEVNANVRIQHVTAHQNGSRSCGG